MRRAFAHFLLIFTVFVASIHTPAIGHEGDEHAIGGHEDIALVASSQDGQDDGSSSAPVGTDVVHHHHCPLALATGDVSPINQALVPRELVPPGLVIALSSCAPDPLLEPPLA